MLIGRTTVEVLHAVFVLLFFTFFVHDLFDGFWSTENEVRGIALVRWRSLSLVLLKLEVELVVIMRTTYTHRIRHLVVVRRLRPITNRHQALLQHLRRLLLHRRLFVQTFLQTASLKHF